MIRNRRSRTRGTEIVEAAIVLPLLLMLVLGAIEYGWLFLNAQKVTNAARQGARIAILPHASAEADATTAITALLNQAGLNDDGPTIDISADTIGGQAGVRVRVTVSTTQLNLVHFSLIPIPPTLGCTVTMAKEGT